MITTDLSPNRKLLNTSILISIHEVDAQDPVNLVTK